MVHSSLSTARGKQGARHFFAHLAAPHWERQRAAGPPVALYRERQRPRGAAPASAPGDRLPAPAGTLTPVRESGARPGKHGCALKYWTRPMTAIRWQTTGTAVPGESVGAARDRATTDRSRWWFAMRAQSIGVGRLWQYGLCVGTIEVKGPLTTRKRGNFAAHAPRQRPRRRHFGRDARDDQATVPYPAHSYGHTSYPMRHLLKWTRRIGAS